MAFKYAWMLLLAFGLVATSFAQSGEGDQGEGDQGEQNEADQGEQTEADQGEQTEADQGEQNEADQGKQTVFFFFTFFLSCTLHVVIPVNNRI